MNHFRFGLVAAQPEAGRSWAQLARDVESLGYSTLLVPDTVHTLAPNIACAVAAAATSTLRVGPYVLAAPNRTPGQVALETRTLRALTNDRYELGIGAGRPGGDSDAAAYGMPFGTPRERMAAVEATVSAVRESSPGTPVLVAASGPRLLEIAGRIADTVALGLPPAADERALGAAVERVRTGGSGRTDPLALEAVELSINLLCVGDLAPPWLARYLNADIGQLIASGSISVLTGSVEAMTETLVRRREQFGISYVCTNVAFAQALAPVVERLAGT